jgi:chorismate--pyruvate lyase
MKGFQFSHTIKGLPNADMTSWLTHPLSLTNKLITLTGDAHLVVLSHQWTVLNVAIRGYFHIKKSDAIVREIIMESNGKSCWYARTIIPKKTHDASEYIFSKLVSHSLGSILYGDYGIEREYGLVDNINHTHLFYQWVKPYVKEDNSTFWIRQAAYMTQLGHPFYLVEVFLPSFLDLIDVK